MTGDVVVETTGETVGEAKWAALRELERLRPGLDKTAVRFEVVTEGERGLLGVGYAPARVVATVPDLQAALAIEPEITDADETDVAADVRGIVELILGAIDARCRALVRGGRDGAVVVECVGPDPGVLIGRNGQTLDAMQYVVNAILANSYEERIEVTVDAAGYRERRRATLEQLAVRSAERALETGRPVELDPMTASERKIVHQRLQELEGVETSSDGREPNRFVVVSPL
jgi:spoIIIJ-associated protein